MEDFYLEFPNPSPEILREHIRNPHARFGTYLFGDATIWFREAVGQEELHHLSFYLGLPNLGVVVYHCGLHDIFVRTSTLRPDLFLVVPDAAPDEFWKLPHSYFCPLDELADVAIEFTRSPPGQFTLDNSWQPFTESWIDLVDDDIC